jgi:hypothetical protein
MGAVKILIANDKAGTHQGPGLIAWAGFARESGALLQIAHPVSVRCPLGGTLGPTLVSLRQERITLKEPATVGSIKGVPRKDDREPDRNREPNQHDNERHLPREHHEGQVHQ